MEREGGTTLSFYKDAIQEWDIISLAKEVHRHYRKHDIHGHWIPYITEYIETEQLLGHCMYVHTVKNNVGDIFGIAIVSLQEEQERNVLYVRILCSKYHCGGKLLQHIMDTYSSCQVVLHSEPTTIGFYKKYGFLLLKDGYERSDIDIRYPRMVSFIREGDVHTRTCDTFFCGYGHLLFYTPMGFYILWSIVGLCVFLVSVY
jgi:predicted GNAT family N-acyltransferase